MDEQGNEIDPRQELIDKVLEYKRYKEASARLAEMEEGRILLVKRGNLQKELSRIGEDTGEGTEIQTITLFRLMKSFERVLQRAEERRNKPVHTVIQFNYTMEESRDYLISLARNEKLLSFEKIFEICTDRIHAIYLFLSVLELVQLRWISLVLGEGVNNFFLEYNQDRTEDEILVN